MAALVARIVLAGLVIALAGCSDGSESEAEPTTTSSLAAPESALVEDYIEALNEGDIDTALGLRCAEAQMEDAAAHDLFTQQVERLVDSTGPITVDSVEMSPDSGLDPLGEGENARALLVELSGNGGSGSAPLDVVVLDQEGGSRVCGVATESAARLHSDKPSIADLGATDRTPQQLMPAEPGEGFFDQVFDGPLPEPAASATASWGRTWQEGDFGGVTVTVSRFASSQEAADFAERERDEKLSDTTEVFDAAGGLGLRYLAYAWLWMQPPGLGDHIDQVILVLGDEVVTVRVTVDGADDHSRVEDVAAAVVELAN